MTDCPTETLDWRLLFARPQLPPRPTTPNQKPPRGRNLRMWAIALAALVGLAIGFLLGRLTLSDRSKAGAHAVLRAPSPPQPDTQAQLHGLANHLIDGDHVTQLSVYAEDLSTGATLSEGADTVYRGASLWKVPTILAWLEAANADPTLLSRPLAFPTSTENDREPANTPGHLNPGQRYAVQDLLTRVAVQSRNDANWLLKTSLPDGAMALLYRRANLDLAQVQAADFQSTVEQYARFFTATMHGQLCSGSCAHRFWDLLEQAEYKYGLRNGIPADVSVAHKFGIRQDPHAREVQLHDCGVVDPTGKPYVLCVMTQGTDQAHQALALSTVARWVHSQWREAPRQ